MKLEIKQAREVKSSALSVLMSMIAHVTIIIAFALIFWPVSTNPSFSFKMQPATQDSDMSIFESVDMTDSLDQFDETVFEPSETELELEQEIDTSVNVEVDAPTLVIGQLPDLSAASETAAPRHEISSSLSSGFFGIQATGNRVVYVIDISLSMKARGRYRTRYERAVKHLILSVEQLKPDQEFFVYCFCFKNVPMRFAGTGKFCKPTKENIRLLRNWLESTELGPGTDPRKSLVEALDDNPTCVFLLSDGEFNGQVYGNGFYGNRISAVQLCREKNANRCPIHTIGLEDMNNQADLQTISEDSGGVYQFVPADR